MIFVDEFSIEGGFVTASDVHELTAVLSTEFIALTAVESADASTVRGWSVVVFDIQVYILKVASRALIVVNSTELTEDIV